MSSAPSSAARERAAGANYEEIIYEGYGPHGVAFIVQSLTDNRNRTVAEVRHLHQSRRVAG